jgi:hypothetical protein
MTVMTQYRAHFTGAWVAQCPNCGIVVPYFDEDDLNENGELTCYCEEGNK